MKLGRILPAGVLIVSLAAVVMLLNGASARAQNPGQGAAPVRLVDPLPLPVTIADGVGVSGTVNVRDVDVAARTPFQTTAGSFQVPADKRLTIELVTVNCRSTGASVPGTFIFLQTKTGSNSVEHRFDARFQLNFSGTNEYVGTHAVRLYADPGTPIITSVLSTFNCTITMSGFLSPA